jgi:hypothetical protein
MTERTSRAIRFVDARVDELSDESCKATVELEHRGVGTFTAIARATSDALTDAVDPNGARVRVVNVQLMESLTKTVVMVTLAVSRGAESQTLLGICDAKDDPIRAAALAVLSATNRFLEPGP